jgi:NADP-dependent 3-hydroxy acid dehydrogenase YdfG
VAIVTSASSATGAAICRSLLNSNAFVLGIDRDTPHHSTRSSRASHFQFLRCDASDPFLSAEIIKAVKKFFEKEEVDFLITVAGEGEWKDDWEGMTGVIDTMAACKKGAVLNVSTGGEGEKDIVSAAR